MSSRALARAIGASSAYISQVERNEIKVPSLRILQEMARVLQVELADLIAATGETLYEDLNLPPDPRLLALSKQLGEQNDLASIVELWPMLTEADRSSIYQAVADLARLRQLIAEARQTASEKNTET